MRSSALPSMALVAAITLLAGTGAGPAVASPSPLSDTPSLLPDVQPFPPGTLSIQVGEGGKRGLRLSVEVANAGVGALELYPVADDCNGNGNFDDDRSAYQRVFADVDGDGVFTREIDTVSTSAFAGCFFFHEAHTHWHFEGWARYDLERLSDGKVVATSGKVSFCLIDGRHPFPELPGSPETGFYRHCEEDDTEGLSVGWADRYSAPLPGQRIDVTRVPDGNYCLAVTGDPDDVLRETDEGDNRASVTVRLEGASVTTIGGSC